METNDTRGIGWGNRIILMVVIAGFFALTTSASAAIIDIPSDYATIQEGIDNAANLDTVLVAPGHYIENLQINGKSIVLSSHFMYDKNTDYIFNTIIDGSNQAHPDTGSTILIKSFGGMISPTVQGFTITGGTGTLYQWQPGSWDRQGGGIFMTGAAAKIQYNYIYNNKAANSAGLYAAGGGGILTNNSAPNILNNVIAYNEGEYGAGMSMNYSTGTVKNNVVAFNYGGRKYGGSGISKNAGSITVIENNTIVYNRSTQPGGGMAIFSSSISLRNNILWHNTAPSDPQIHGFSSGNYCNIEGGGLTGTGNIDVEPKLIYDNWFFPFDDSPCIDAGTPTPIYYDAEDPGNLGTAKWPSCGTLTNDIGAYGGPGAFPFQKGAIFCDATLGKIPLTINFTGKSIFPDVASWIWFFGNGDSSVTAVPNCTYEYTAPGMYDVSLKIVVGTDTTLITHGDMIVATADTAGLGNVEGRIGETVEIILTGNNTMPLDYLEIPLQYGGDLELHYAGASTTGLRSEGFVVSIIDNDESANRRIVLGMQPGTANPDAEIAPGDGPLAALQFEIVSGAPFDENVISLEGYDDYMLTYKGGILSYHPDFFAGQITAFLKCGDVTGNNVVDLLDIVYMINAKFKGGPQPPLETADVNNDTLFNLLDIVYMVNFKFKGGPPPNCG